MKGNKQKRLELKAKQEQQAEKLVQKHAAALQARLARDGIGHLAVNREKLAPDGSYDTPGFVTRGFYLDQPFTCIDCGKAEIWTEAQQKWWYEIAKAVSGRWRNAAVPAGAVSANDEPPRSASSAKVWPTNNWASVSRVNCPSQTEIESLAKF